MQKNIEEDTAIVWIRNDFRIEDNPALAYALRNHKAVLCLYIDKTDWTKPSASEWWLHNAIVDFSDLINERLLVLEGDEKSIFESLFHSHKFTAVYWNRRYEPILKEIDKNIKIWLKSNNIFVESFPGNYLIEPWEVTKLDGSPYRVFTPFYRAVMKHGLSDPYKNILKKELDKLVKIDYQKYFSKRKSCIPEWMENFGDSWKPTAAEGKKIFSQFADKIMPDYEEGRNFPAKNFCSKLSPWLHHGQISARHIAKNCQKLSYSESFLRELVWREFANYVMFHYPDTAHESMDKRFDKMPWLEDKQGFEAWRKGRTGIPLVDAGMRELWTTGFMHNRVRMVVASFLTKHLMIDWRKGADWFEKTLLDADLSSNRMGWQWCAGSGVDAAPYFRIFNPTSQGLRFDAQGAYVKKWVPELKSLPAKWVHNPWEAPPEVLKEAKVEIGFTYPNPIVDLKFGRERALAAWSTIKN